LKDPGQTRTVLAQLESIFRAIACSSARFSLKAVPSEAERVKEIRVSVIRP
jgi:hypothetical protein